MDQLKLFNNEKEVDKTAELTDKIMEMKKNCDASAFYRFQRYLFMALLHQSPQKYLAIDKAIEQAKTHGVSYVLCKISPEAKKFIEFARQVSFERYRATAFVRLRPIDQYGVLFGEFEIKHQTAELIMLHFTKRFPQYKIMLIFGNEVYIGKGKEIFKEKIDRENIKLPEKKDKFEKYWLTFYKTQYIPERKNLRYLKRMIPVKYWKWVTELKEFGLA